MKYSNYNSIIRVNNDSYILYNSMSDKYIILKKSAYEDLCKCNADDLSVSNGELYSQLCDAKGIVDDSLDESKSVTELIKQSVEDDSTYYLHINPTLDCNFSCWYCYENHILGSKMPVKVMESIKKLIDHIIEGQTNLHTFIISFFGGEPLMYFNSIARQLIDYLYCKCTPKGIKVRIHFTSNGYLLNDRMLDYFRGKELCFQITLDGAREDHNQTRFANIRRGSYDRIMVNVKKLIEIGSRIILRINYTSSNISNVYRIRQDLDCLDMASRNLIDVDFQRVWQDVNAEKDNLVNDMVSKCISMFHKDGYRVSSHKVLNSVQNVCYGDKKYHLLVNYNGDIFNCTARDFARNNRVGYLRSDGIVVWENNSFNNRMELKFNLSVCHNCRIAPICGGGCSQVSLERSSDDGCLYLYSDEDIDRIILNRFEYLFLSNKD